MSPNPPNPRIAPEATFRSHGLHVPNHVPNSALLTPSGDISAQQTPCKTNSSNLVEPPLNPKVEGSSPSRPTGKLAGLVEAYVPSGGIDTDGDLESKLRDRVQLARKPHRAGDFR